MKNNINVQITMVIVQNNGTLSHIDHLDTYLSYIYYILWSQYSTDGCFFFV